MSVVLRDGVAASIPNIVRLRNARCQCAFVSARDYYPEHDEYTRHGVHSTADFKNSPLAEKYVGVILGYFDGHLYIGEQLQSILNQTHRAVHIFLCDDHSNSCFSLNNIDFDLDQVSKISIAVRPHNVGFANNFLNALASVPDEFEYYAFSDQDDVWHEGKLESAIDELKKVSSDKPALYCARTEIADATCKHALGYSPLFSKPPSFANALVQNIGGGNTMVFNKAARGLIVDTTRDVTVVSHDWWCYQIVAGAGGCIIYDPQPCLKYRQHAHNLMGVSTNWRARLLRIRGLFQGRFRAWNDINLTALAERKHLLTVANQLVLNNFIEARQSFLTKRLMLFKRSGIYRQTLFGNLGLLLGILLNKV